MIGAHHARSPSADSERGPRDVIANMMALAHAVALMRLSPENLTGDIPA